MGCDDRYLIEYFPGGETKIEVMTQREMFELLQKWYGAELDPKHTKFTVTCIGECILDFSQTLK